MVKTEKFPFTLLRRQEGHHAPARRLRRPDRYPRAKRDDVKHGDRRYEIRPDADCDPEDERDRNGSFGPEPVCDEAEDERAEDGARLDDGEKDDDLVVAHLEDLRREDCGEGDNGEDAVIIDEECDQEPGDLRILLRLEQQDERALCLPETPGDVTAGRGILYGPPGLRHKEKHGE